jgi:hypothetical protein
MADILLMRMHAPVAAAVRARTFRWHGGLCLDPRLLLKVMLAVIVARLILPGGSAQYASACVCGGASARRSFAGLSGMLVGTSAPTGRRTS